jgi:hypothetical protein
MQLSKALTFIVAALCVGLPIGGSILFVGSKFHPPAHDAKTETGAGRPAFVKEEVEGYLEKWIGDPVAQGTLGLVLVTGVLAFFTYRLFKSTRDMAAETKVASDKALAASTKATETLVSVERPYVTVGGEYKRLAGMIHSSSAGKPYFRFEVGNYGKTAAVLTGFAVRFDSLTNVQARPNDIGLDRRYHDLLEPGSRHKVINDDTEITVDINSGTNVAYGACWYQSGLQKEDHIACFALKLRGHSTFIDDDVLTLDPSYRRWD